MTDIIAQKQIDQVTKLKKSQIQIQKLFSFDEKLFKRICLCGQQITLKTYEHVHTLEQIKRIDQAKTCQLRFCPLCNFYRVRRLSPQIIKVLRDLKKQGKELIFITLTVPNCRHNEQRATISKMNKAFNLMGRNQDFKNNVTHWIRTTEVTFKKEQAHPHFHCIFAVDKSYFKHGNYLRTKDWGALWSRCYKSDKGLIVDARSIKPKREGLDPISSAVAELSKYVIKSSDLKKIDCADMPTIYEQLKGLRFIATSRNIKLDDEKETEIDEEIWRLIEMIICDWTNEKQSYSAKKKYAF